MRNYIVSTKSNNVHSKVKNHSTKTIYIVLGLAIEIQL